MIKILQVGNVDSFVESRRQKTLQKDRKIVHTILDDVRKNGDSAVKKYEQKFNGKKTYKGFLQGIDENGYILLETEDYEMKVDFLEIEKANIDPDWSIKNNQII